MQKKGRSIISQQQPNEIQQFPSEFTSGGPPNRFQRYAKQIREINWGQLFYDNIKAIFILILLIIGIWMIYGVYSKHASQHFYQIDKLPTIKQLPLCLLLIPSAKYQQSELLASIKKQNYLNYITLNSNNVSENYYSNLKNIQTKCKPYSIILFVNIPFRSGALEYLNRIMYHYRAWVFYVDQQGQGKVEVIAAYGRVYQLLGVNDFNGTNREALVANNRAVQAMGLMELCADYRKKVERAKIYDDIHTDMYFSTSPESIQAYPNRIRYTKILRLSQDFEPANLTYLQLQKSIMPTVVPFTRMSYSQMYRALDWQELPYLPEQHPIAQLEYQYHNHYYQISPYISNPQRQVHFCVTVISHNNIPQNRYIKVFKTILQQKYQNYHIVFIDDNSDDGTLDRTIQYVREIGANMENIVFVRNRVRKWATYNILNAAFNYCGDGDVQLLVDGDDQLVGRYAFQVMNSAYQQNPNIWLAYSNFKSCLYSFGLSKPYWFSFQKQFMGKRVGRSYIGPIRTWRVQLLRHIPIAYHKFNNTWLHTLYDDAILQCLIEYSGFSRMTYIPEMLYDYNTEYGDNDNANQERLRLRLETYRHVLSLPVLPELRELGDAGRNEDVWRELDADRGIMYETVRL